MEIIDVDINCSRIVRTMVIHAKNGEWNRIICTYSIDRVRCLFTDSGHSEKLDCPI